MARDTRMPDDVAALTSAMRSRHDALQPGRDARRTVLLPGGGVRPRRPEATIRATDMWQRAGYEKPRHEQALEAAVSVIDPIGTGQALADTVRSAGRIVRGRGDADDVMNVAATIALARMGVGKRPTGSRAFKFSGMAGRRRLKAGVPAEVPSGKGEGIERLSATKTVKLPREQILGRGARHAEFAEYAQPDPDLVTRQPVGFLEGNVEALAPGLKTTVSMYDFLNDAQLAAERNKMLAGARRGELASAAGSVLKPAVGWVPPAARWLARVPSRVNLAVKSSSPFGAAVAGLYDNSLTRGVGSYIRRHPVKSFFGGAVPAASLAAGWYLSRAEGKALDDGRIATALQARTLALGELNARLGDAEGHARAAGDAESMRRYLGETLGAVNRLYAAGESLAQTNDTEEAANLAKSAAWSEASELYRRVYDRLAEAAGPETMRYYEEVNGPMRLPETGGSR